jgi:TonB-dependent SusC/RagA subfamily outer membrane receptor
MKLTLLILFIAVMGTWAVESYAQSTRLTLKMENASIEEVLKKIEDRSEFRFFYNGKIDVDKLVTVNLKNKNVLDILDAILEGTNIKYEIVGRQVALFNSNTVPSEFAAMQQHVVSGKVSGPQGEPIPGVSVVIKGTNVGTLTDSDGKFTISNVSPDAVLLFSFVGMKSREMKVGNQTNINVALEEETIGWEEVVAVGYGTVRKKDLTGSVSSVNNEKLMERATFSAAQALQGKAAGVVVQQKDAKPGSDASVMIRGNRSLKATNSPLYVVDGVPLVVGLSEISQSDIESIDILKDASATAIYGSRGANGVVLITTKKGKEGKAVIEYNAYYGSKNCQIYRTVRRPEWVEFLREAYRTTGNTRQRQLLPWTYNEPVGRRMTRTELVQDSKCV